MALLAQQHQLAEIEQPFSTLEERAQQAYSGYTAGTPMRDRYLISLPYADLPAHPDDRAFLKNFRQAPADDREPDLSQPEGLRDLLYRSREGPGRLETLPARPGDQARPQLLGETPAAQGTASQPSSSPLPGPLQRMKENPGELFMQSPARPDEKNAARPTFRGIDLVPSLSNLRRPRSLGDILAPPLSAQPPGALPGPLQHLKENPGELFVPRSGFTAQSGRAIQQAARNGYVTDVDNFKATILQAAAQNHVSPNLLLGLAERESSLDPDRVNEIGAKGLFQLLPARQKDLGIVGNDVFDYKVVIPKVAGALRNALDRYQGNIELALASWALGDGKLQEHLGQAQQRGQDPMQRIRSLLLYGDDPRGPRLGTDYIDFVTKYVVNRK